MVFVQTGLETDDWVEVEAEGLTEGTPVVTSGQDRLNPGMKVRLLQEAN